MESSDSCPSKTLPSKNLQTQIDSIRIGEQSCYDSDLTIQFNPSENTMTANERYLF